MWLYHIKYIKQIEYENKIWFFLHFLRFRAIIVGVLYVIKIFMKKIFMQLWQWILKYKKKLIYGTLALFIGQICFFWLWWIGVQNEVFAADGENPQEQMVTKLYDLSALLSKIIYIIMYPLLMIAWKLVDNSLVYWEDFYFDSLLWNLWIIVRNIANFALWFIFIFYIFKYLITQKEDFGPKKLIPKVLIAWIWIQASWFIMAALIDISTIITYWVGWLPITVLWTDDTDNLKYNPYVLNTVVSVDGKDIDSYHVYLSNTSGDKFISTCRTFVYSATWENNEKIEEELILAPEMVYYMSGDDECYPTQPDRCHIGDQVYKISGDPYVDTASISTCTEFKNSQNDFKEILAYNEVNYKNYSISSIEEAANAGYLLRVWQTWNNFWLDEWSQEIWTEWWSYRIQDILSGSYVWVFGALYGSLLNAWADLRISRTSSNGLYVKFLNTALSLGHMVAISIPLIVMLVVFMIRICVLRVAIVLSPIIVLLKVFDFEKKIDELGVKFLKYLKVENLIWIIFSPAIMCFAISISTVLVRVITAENWDMIDSISKPILWWLIKLSLAWVWINIWKMFVSVIWIAITWFLVWAAVKSSAIWKDSEIVKGLEDFAKSTLWSIPIVPVPTLNGWWVTWVGTNAAKDLPSRISNSIKNKYNTNETLQDLLDPSRVEKRRENESNRATVYASIIGKNDFVVDHGWMSRSIDIYWDKSYENTFNDFSSSNKKTIINEINKISNVNKRREFGNVSPTIEFKDWDKNVIYEFDDNENIYKEKKQQSWGSGN